MAITFPSSPTNGQTVVVGASTYTWNAISGTWDLTTTAVIGPQGPAGALYGNLDGGLATSNYNGLTAISGGNASGN